MKEKTKSLLDKTTRKRISEIQWKKGTKKVTTRVAAFFVTVLDNDKEGIKSLYNGISEAERKIFDQMLQVGLTSLARDSYDRFLENVQPLLKERTRQNLEEIKHVNISDAIDKLISELGRHPARCEIVHETGYSSQAVNSHLASYDGGFIQRNRKEELPLMREKMMAICYEKGINGDMKAAKLFLETTSEPTNNTFSKNEQNNFIQVNGYIITSEQLMFLPHEKQKQIQDIIGLLNSREERS